MYYVKMHRPLDAQAKQWKYNRINIQKHTFAALREYAEEWQLVDFQRSRGENPIAKREQNVCFFPVSSWKQIV